MCDRYIGHLTSARTILFRIRPRKGDSEVATYLTLLQAQKLLLIQATLSLLRTVEAESDMDGALSFSLSRSRRQRGLSS